MTIMSQERRDVIAVARRYRREGYQVSGPDELSARPSFLGDLKPDLIAEREDDKVVIEVKRATAVRGSNQIVELAERVAGQPGWRFELIAVRPPSLIERPDLARSDVDIRHLIDSGFAKPAFIWACSMIEGLVAYGYARLNRNPANTTFPALIHELMVRGVIAEAHGDGIRAAQKQRDAIVHHTDEPSPTRDEVEALLALASDLERELAATDA